MVGCGGAGKEVKVLVYLRCPKCQCVQCQAVRGDHGGSKTMTLVYDWEGEVVLEGFWTSVEGVRL